MEFVDFRNAIQNNIMQMMKNASHLYEVDLDKDQLYNLYLDSFPAENNKIFRERREHDCSACRSFIRSFGNVVVIENYKIHTIWEVDGLSDAFQKVADAMDKFVKSHPVTDVFIAKFAKFGIDHNHEQFPDGKVRTWHHLYVELPSRFVNTSSRSVGDLKGPFRDTKNVFKRSLEEISDEAVDTVLELIHQNSLYKGPEWEWVLQEFKRYKEMYKNVPQELRDNFAWIESHKAGSVVGRIRNHSIGTLLTDITNDVDLDEAVRKYETIVAPTNYKRPKPIYTKRMLEDAKKTVTDLGYMPSLARRYATLDDITVNNILFCNRDAAQRIQSAADLFGEMESGITIDPRKFSRVQEISIDDFIKNVLPGTTSVEALVENRHSASMVSLIAPVNKDAKSMFKWANGFSWAYSGNITDSNIRENVKSAGGKVDGVLRFSIQWNDDEFDPNDLDAHCKLPRGNEIFFGRKKDYNTLGELDIDIIRPDKNVPAVENITWPSMSKMEEGTYVFFVHCYTNRGGRSGFKAEIEFDGTIHSYEYPHELRQDEVVPVAEVTYSRAHGFSIKEVLKSSISSKEIWAIKSNQFVPVSVIMYSPNYWDEQDGIGHRHYFFMLDGCKNPEKPNGFYNEFLKPELEKHRRVFEALGSKAAVQDVDDQLSGLGFSSSKRNNLLVRIKGATERILKIIF